jgi:hypothetical protein
MTIQQTIKIPANRRIVIEVPETFSSGAVSVILLDVPKPKAPDVETRRRQREAVEKGWGIAKDFKFSSDDLIRNRREDLALENAKWERLRRQASENAGNE